MLYVLIIMYSFTLFYALTAIYNPFLVYCRELAPDTVTLTGDRAQGDDNKHDSQYTPSEEIYNIR